MTDLIDILKETKELYKDINTILLYYHDIYGISVVGRFKVVIYDEISFERGGGVLIYKLLEINHAESKIGLKNMLLAKQFYKENDKIIKYQKDSEIIIKGTLENEVYKERSGNWVNKGIYIKILDCRDANIPIYQPRNKNIELLELYREWFISSPNERNTILEEIIKLEEEKK